MSEPSTESRRERKKAGTRNAIASAALRLFLEKGYDAVTVAEIAEAADTAVATLFKHFPDGKESLVFGGPGSDATGAENRSALLVEAIHQRPANTRVLDAIETFIAARGPFVKNQPPDTERRLRLIRDTPALRAYAREQWRRTEGAVAGAMAQATGRKTDDTAIAALARFALEAPDLTSDRDQRQALHEIFDHLRTGWPDL